MQAMRIVGDQRSSRGLGACDVVLTHHLKGHDRAKERSNESCEGGSELRSASEGDEGHFPTKARSYQPFKHWHSLGNNECDDYTEENRAEPRRPVNRRVGGQMASSTKGADEEVLSTQMREAVVRYSVSEPRKRF